MKKIFLAACFLAVFLPLTCFSQEESLLPVKDDFEKDGSEENIVFWCGGPPTTNEQDQYCSDVKKGLSTEYAHSGKKSLKLEFNTSQGQYIYWRRDIRINMNKPIYLSGYILPLKLPAGAVAGMGYSGIYKDQVNSAMGSTGENKEWKSFAINVREALRKLAAPEEQDPEGLYMDAYYIYIAGPLNGEKVIIYLDDISIEDFYSRFAGVIAENRAKLKEIEKTLKPDDKDNKSELSGYADALDSYDKKMR